MDRAPFSAFLLLLVGIVLLAQFVTGNLDAFLGELLGQASGTGTGGTGGTGTGAGTGTAAKPPTYAGNARST